MTTILNNIEVTEHEAEQMLTADLQAALVHNAKLYIKIREELHAKPCNLSWEDRKDMQTTLNEINATQVVISREKTRREFKRSPVGFANRAKFEASRMHYDLQREDRRAKFVSRDVEVIALDAKRERIADVVFVDVPSRVSGKKLRAAAEECVNYYGDDAQYFAIEGSFDEFESVAEFFASNGENYTPSVAYWSFTVTRDELLYA
jgi:hypothetical protein